MSTVDEENVESQNEERITEDLVAGSEGYTHDSSLEQTGLTTDPGGEEPNDTNQCNCCHCCELRQVQRQIAFKNSPEGQKREELKLFSRCFFTDLMVMDHMRKLAQETLNDTKLRTPCARDCYPVCIMEATEAGSSSLFITWFIHDISDIFKYDIFVDGKLKKTVLDPKLTSTAIVDVDLTKFHKIILVAKPEPEKKDDFDINAILAEFNLPKSNEECECECKDLVPVESMKAKYMKNKCGKSTDFWKASVFLYDPVDCDKLCGIKDDALSYDPCDTTEQASSSMKTCYCSTSKSEGICKQGTD